MRSISVSSLPFTLALAAASAVSLVSAEARADFTATPTFESAGLYWSDSGGDATTAAHVRYRASGATTWVAGPDLWFDVRAAANGTPAARPAREYRGSLMGLTAGTTYEVQVWLEGSCAREELTVTTWSEDFPIARTVMLPMGSTTGYTITEGGTPDGYVLYLGGSFDVGATESSPDSVIVVDAPYVIIRGTTIRGGRHDSIGLRAHAHDIVIEDCDMSDYGLIHSDSRFPSNPRQYDELIGEVRMPLETLAYCDRSIANEAAAVRCYEDPASIGTTWPNDHDRIIVQRNRMHDPHCSGGQWWNSGRHPLGATGVSLSSCGGNHVIRYNEITSTPDRCFVDGISGGENFSWLGAFPYDSDIYGNHINGACDDGIEVDGGNRNTRVFGNRIENAYVNLSFASNSVGPAYAYRNVVIPGMPGFGGPRIDPTNARLTNDFRFLKTGTPVMTSWTDPDPVDPPLSARDWYFSPPYVPGEVVGSGRLFAFHNTVQWTGGQGASVFAGGSGGFCVRARDGACSTATHPHTPAPPGAVWMRNNIIQLRARPGAEYGAISIYYSEDVNLDPYAFDYDYLSGPHEIFIRQDGATPFAAGSAPRFLEGHAIWGRPTFDAQGALAAGDPGVNAAERLPGINDRFEGSAPDMGAQEQGAAPLAFGRMAYRSESWNHGGMSHVEPAMMMGCVEPDAGMLDAGASADAGASMVDAGTSMVDAGTSMRDVGMSAGRDPSGRMPCACATHVRGRAPTATLLSLLALLVLRRRRR